MLLYMQNKAVLKRKDHLLASCPHRGHAVTKLNVHSETFPVSFLTYSSGCCFFYNIVLKDITGTTRDVLNGLSVLSTAAILGSAFVYGFCRSCFTHAPSREITTAPRTQLCPFRKMMERPQSSGLGLSQSTELALLSPFRKRQSSAIEHKARNLSGKLTKLVSVLSTVRKRMIRLSSYRKRRKK